MQRERVRERDILLAKERGEGGGSIGADALIPGLPDDLVLAEVVTRLPWYVRPVCRAVSKSWTASIDTSRKRLELQLKSREYQLPLLIGHILVCTFDTHIFISKDCIPHEELYAAGYYTVQWHCYTYQIHRNLRKLPPLQGLLPAPPTWATLLARFGMVYVWSNEEPSNFVLKIDLGCGDWTWNKIPVSHPFNANTIQCNGKIYVPRVWTEKSGNPEEAMLVYDMMTDQCELVKAWNCDNLTVLRKKSSLVSSYGEEELYSFVEHESFPDPLLEILVYDACKDSWTSWDKIPIPEWRWSVPLHVHLVNSECFDPAPDVGINTIWIKSESKVISWFNASVQETWVGFNYNAFLDGKCLEYIQFIHGSLYGIFIEDKDREDDVGDENRHSQQKEDRRDQQDPTLFKRTLMKGTMLVSTNNVNWEEVLDIGCFEEVYYLNGYAVSSMDDCTLMA